MIKLDQIEAELKKYTPRTELHGPENEPAATLQFEISGLNKDILALFDDRLLKTFYTRDEDEEDMDESYLPRLRFPEIQSIPWKYESSGYRLIVHDEITEREALVLIKTEFKVTNIEIEEGGNVNVTFNINGHPNEEEAGWIYSHQKRVLIISLEPPSPEQRAQQELDMEDAA